MGYIYKLQPTDQSVIRGRSRIPGRIDPKAGTGYAPGSWAANLVWWYDTDAMTGSAPVTGATDLSPNGYDISSFTGSSSLQGDYNGHSELYFPGNQAMDVPGAGFAAMASGTADRTILLVIGTDGGKTENYEHAFHYGNNATGQSWGICARVSGSNNWGNHYWNSSYNTGDGSGANRIIIVSRSSGTDSWYQGGSLIGTHSHGNSVVLSDRAGFGHAVSGAEHWAYGFLMAAFWNSAMDSDNVTLATEILEARYGI